MVPGSRYRALALLEDTKVEISKRRTQQEIDSLVKAFATKNRIDLWFCPHGRDSRPFVDFEIIAAYYYLLLLIIAAQGAAPKGVLNRAIWWDRKP